MQIDNILQTRLHINIKYVDLHRNALSQSIMWLCIFVFAEICILYLARENAAYFYFCLTYLLPFVTSSLSYIQIITWVKQIKQRFDVLIQLISDMDSGENEITELNAEAEKCVRNIEQL